MQSEKCTLKVAIEWLYITCGNEKQNYQSWTKNTLFGNLLRMELSDEFKQSYFFANYTTKNIANGIKMLYIYKHFYLKYEFKYCISNTAQGSMQAR